MKNYGERLVLSTKNVDNEHCKLLNQVDVERSTKNGTGNVLNLAQHSTIEDEIQPEKPSDD